MSTGLTNTHMACGFSDLYHVFARKPCVLCYALRHKCLTLLYVTSIRDFFCPWDNHWRLYKLPPRSLASSPCCLLQLMLNNRWITLPENSKRRTKNPSKSQKKTALTVREISISWYMMTSLMIASWTFKEKSVFSTLLRRYYLGSFHLSHETTRCL